MVLPAFPFIQMEFAARHQWPNRVGNQPADLISSFHDRLCVFMNQNMRHMNAVHQPEGSLIWAERFLLQLIAVLDTARATLAENAAKETLSGLLNQNQAEFKKIV